MKKKYFLLILLSGYFGFSQNQFPTAKGSSVLIDGGHVNMIRPATTGGWARGLHYIRQDNTRYAGVGMLGSADTPKYLYMAHGGAPWSSEEGIYVLSNGRIGIGTTTPTAKLQVKGTGTIGAKWNPSGSYLTVGSSLLIDPNEIYAAQTLNIGTKSGDIVRFKTISDSGSADKMVIKSSGNVGIGTMSPDAKLAVNGVIHSKEVKVDLNGWSDFVFKEDYNLPTLEEVEQHIQEKGYLKDIPSAKEVKENGIFLGDMDAKLLQKIEELTLYTIQQQKMIKTQGQMIRELKNEIQQLKNN